VLDQWVILGLNAIGARSAGATPPARMRIAQAPARAELVGAAPVEPRARAATNPGALLDTMGTGWVLKSPHVDNSGGRRSSHASAPRTTSIAADLKGAARTREPCARAAPVVRL
jgi:hypothetical protein